MESISDVVLQKIREIRRDMDIVSQDDDEVIIVSDNDDNDTDDENDVIFIGETIVISDNDEDLIKEIGNYPV